MEGSCSTKACVPFPWCTSQSTISTRGWSSCCAWRAATTTLLMKQNPIARAAKAWCPGGRVAPKAVPVAMPRSTAPMATPAAATAASQLSAPITVSASSAPPLWRLPRRGPRLAPFYGGGHLGCAQRREQRDDAVGALGMSEARVMALAGGVKDDTHHLAGRVPAVQQRSDGFHLRPHLAPRLLELSHGAPVAAPAKHDEHGGDATGDAAHDQHRTPETEARVEQQQGIEREARDGQQGEHPAEGLHRTGWRRAGRTMKGELGPAPSAARVVPSSSTCAPLNLTT